MPAKAKSKKSSKGLVGARFRFNKLGALAIAAVLSVAGAVYVYSSHASSPTPEGKLAYVDYYTGRLFTINDDAMARKQLTKSGLCHNQVNWSRDHTILATSCYTHGAGDVSLVNPDTGVSVTQVNPSSMLYDEIHFGTDNTLYYRGYISSEDRSFIYKDVYDPTTLKPISTTVAYNGGLGNPHTYQVSPDGAKIIFEVWNDYSPKESAVYLVSTSHDNPTKIADMRSNCFLDYGRSSFGDYFWSPDGKHYVMMCANFTTGQQMLRVYDVNSFTPKVINLPEYFLGAVSWSPNSNTIAYSGTLKGTGKENVYYLSTINPDGTGHKIILKRRGVQLGFSGFADWSPSGNKLMYLTDTIKDNTYYDNVHTINLDGTGDTQIFSSRHAEDPNYFAWRSY